MLKRLLVAAALCRVQVVGTRGLKGSEQIAQSAALALRRHARVGIDDHPQLGRRRAVTPAGDERTGIRIVRGALECVLRLIASEVACERGRRARVDPGSGRIFGYDAGSVRRYGHSRRLRPCEGRPGRLAERCLVGPVLLVAEATMTVIEEERDGLPGSGFDD